MDMPLSTGAGHPHEHAHEGDGTGDNEDHVEHDEENDDIPHGYICFVAGTLVDTDQGQIPIELLTSKNSIHGLFIQVIT